MSDALLRFNATVVGVDIGGVTVMDDKGRKASFRTTSMEEDLALAALLYQRVTITVAPMLQPTAAGRAR